MILGIRFALFGLRLPVPGDESTAWDTQMSCTSTSMPMVGSEADQMGRETSSKQCIRPNRLICAFR